MADEKVKVIRLETKEAEQSIGNLRKQLKELRNTMLSCEQGTDEYNKALKQAAAIQHTLKEQMEEVNATAMDFGQIAQNCTKAIGGMVAGFQAAKAVMNLFDIENETVIKSLQQMQNLMALTQALPAIDSAVKAFKRLSIVIAAAAGATNTFSKALISTGLGAAAAALGLLIANWDKIAEKVGITNKALRDEAVKERTKDLNDFNNELERERDLQKQLSKIRGDSDVEAERKNIQLMDEQLKALNDRLEEETKKYEDAVNIKTYRSIYKQLLPERKQQIDSTIAGFDTIKKGLTELITELEKEKKAAEDNIPILQALENARKAVDIQETTEKLRELNEETLRWLQNMVQANEIEYGKNLMSGWDEIEERAKEHNEEMRTLREQEQKEIDEDADKAVNGLMELYKLEALSFKELFYELFQTSTEEINEMINRLTGEAYEIQKGTLETSLGALDEWYRKWSTIFAKNMLETYDTDLVAYEQYKKAKENLDIVYLNRYKQYQAKTIQTVGMIAVDFGDIIGNLAEVMEEGASEQKGIATMIATINMLGGITAALAGAFTTKTGPWDIALAVSQAIAIASAGAANIAQIQRTDKDNAASIANGASNSSNVMNTIIAPVQYTQDIDNADIEGAIRDTRVYVVESDITNTQRKVSVTENEAKF